MDNRKYRYDITFVCFKGHENFAEPILRELSQKYRIQYILVRKQYELWFKKIEGKVIWVEWAKKFANFISRKKLDNRRVFVRVHGGEVYNRYMKKIKWSNIDHVIFVNPFYEDEFHKLVGEKVNTSFIPNAIDTDSFPLVSKNSGKSICAFGCAFRPVKGYDKLLVFFKKLLEHDEEFHLTIMGQVVNQKSSLKNQKRLKQLVSELNLENNCTIIERDRTPSLVDDKINVSEFLAKHDIIMSYSESESFHYAFAEGLLSGLQGFYNMWHNSMIKIFWEKWGYNSEDDMINGILEWVNLSQEVRNDIVKKNREYIISNFGNEYISMKYENLFFGENNGKT